MPDWVRDTYQPRTGHGGTDEGTRGLRYLEWDRDLAPDSEAVRTDYVIVTREGDEVAVHHDIHMLGIYARATWLELTDPYGWPSHPAVVTFADGAVDRGRGR